MEVLSKIIVNYGLVLQVLKEINENWKQIPENEKCFVNHSMGCAMYFYDDHVRYFDDLAATSHYARYKIPNDAEGIKAIINTSEPYEMLPHYKFVKGVGHVVDK